MHPAVDKNFYFKNLALDDSLSRCETSQTTYASTSLDKNVYDSL